MQRRTFITTVAAVTVAGCVSSAEEGEGEEDEVDPSESGPNAEYLGTHENHEGGDIDIVEIGTGADTQKIIRFTEDGGQVEGVAELHLYANGKEVRVEEEPIANQPDVEYSTIQHTYNSDYNEFKLAIKG